MATGGQDLSVGVKSWLASCGAYVRWADVVSAKPGKQSLGVLRATRAGRPAWFAAAVDRVMGERTFLVHQQLRSVFACGMCPGRDELTWRSADSAIWPATGDSKRPGHPQGNYCCL